MSARLGTDPSRKGAELTQLRAFHRRVEKDRDALELAFNIERDQLLFNEMRKCDRLLGILDRAIEIREAR